MKNKRILKNALLILLGLVVIALYIYDKRGGFTASSKQESAEVILTNENQPKQTDGLQAPISNKNTGQDIPPPKPSN